MKFGLDSSQFEFLMKNVVLPLEVYGATVWCYGSRARGDNHPFSDLDLMVESDQDLSPQLSRIREFLVDSNFPYKVDLVALSEFAESYKDVYLQDRILFAR